MFKAQNTIIIVDNRPEQLDILSRPFHRKGMSCRALTYDATYQAPLTNIRIAFFDINLSDINNPAQNAAQIYAVLADALRSYISAENGPFALIFWTSNASLINGFKEYINNHDIEVPSPIVINHIDKDEFLENIEENLETKLQQVLSDQLIELLFDFETVAAEAASKTINQFYGIIPRSETWGNTEYFTSSFEKVFSKVAETSLGLALAKKNPAKAVYSALLPVFTDSINLGSIEDKWSDILISLANCNTSSDLQYPIGFNARKLNTAFHIEENQELNPKTRGSVTKLLVQSPSITYSSGHQYFQELAKETEALFNLFVRFNYENTTSARRDYVRGSSEFVVVEISASCDFAQEKKRIHKYVLGLMSPILSEDEAQNSSGAVLNLPEIVFQQNEFQFRLNLNFVYGSVNCDDRFHKTIFLLKGNIMDLIGTSYANHVARIGITKF